MHLNDALHHLQSNCDLMMKLGNGSRMEITCKSMRFGAHHESLLDAFHELIAIVDKVVTYYDIAEDVVTCTMFFARGLRIRSDYAVSHFVNQARQAECSHM